MEKTITIQIAGVDYVIKQSFRSLLMFEDMTKSSVENMEENLNNTLTLFYCILKAGNRNTFLFSFDEFIDLMDSNVDSLTVFSEYLQSLAQAQELPKKKVTKKA